MRYERCRGTEACREGGKPWADCRKRETQNKRHSKSNSENYCRLENCVTIGFRMRKLKGETNPPNKSGCGSYDLSCSKLYESVGFNKQYL